LKLKPAVTAGPGNIYGILGDKQALLKTGRAAGFNKALYEDLKSTE
jgi:hypothetical protein